jgi:hypothetical protein
MAEYHQLSPTSAKLFDFEHSSSIADSLLESALVPP